MVVMIVAVFTNPNIKWLCQNFEIGTGKADSFLFSEA